MVNKIKEYLMGHTCTNILTLGTMIPLTVKEAFLLSLCFLLPFDPCHTEQFESKAHIPPESVFSLATQRLENVDKQHNNIKSNAIGGHAPTRAGSSSGVI